MTRAERSFDRLYRRHQGDVYRYAYAVLRNQQDAEDVVQQTFLNAYRAMAQGAKPERPQHWLIKIAHNVCRQRFRDSSRRPAEVELNEELAPATPTQTGALTAADIQAALGHLTFNQRAALVARELEGRSYAEIATLLELSESAVETLLFRARRALREHLEGGLTCAEAEAALSRELDGELPRAEKGPLRGHLRECAECASLARSMRARKKALRAIWLAPLPWASSTPVWVGVGVKAAAVVAAGTVVVGGTYHEVALEKPAAAHADVKRFVPHDPLRPNPRTFAVAAQRHVVRHRVARRTPAYAAPAPGVVVHVAAARPVPAPVVRRRAVAVRRVAPKRPAPVSVPAAAPAPPAVPAPEAAPPAPQEAAATAPHPGKACEIHGRGHDAEHGRDEEQC